MSDLLGINFRAVEGNVIYKLASVVLKQEAKEGETKEGKAGITFNNNANTHLYVGAILRKPPPFLMQEFLLNALAKEEPGFSDAELAEAAKELSRLKSSIAMEPLERSKENGDFNGGIAHVFAGAVPLDRLQAVEEQDKWVGIWVPYASIGLTH